ncbi:hypothetical protein [Pantoea sp. BAV 3049]|uniref:hypothetical protein n=1 Tax=Pantoea sp. BAV 3049 TaxID=2654188 RepID=UPI00131C00C3|nr:hypothetical protein [Pantoea sp. BAV 3049]
MNGLSVVNTLIAAAIFISLQAQAEKITVSLSEEQDGGSAGRACLYVHQGKAEYRLVKPDEICPSSVTLDASASRT